MSQMHMKADEPTSFQHCECDQEQNLSDSKYVTVYEIMFFSSLNRSRKAKLTIQTCFQAQLIF